MSLKYFLHLFWKYFDKTKAQKNCIKKTVDKYVPTEMHNASPIKKR